MNTLFLRALAYGDDHPRSNVGAQIRRRTMALPALQPGDVEVGGGHRLPMT